MKRNIIIYSPILYSFFCFLTNLILLLSVIFICIFALFKLWPVWLSILFGILFCASFWLIFFSLKLITGYDWYIIPFINSATATSQSFIHFHKIQKTKNLKKGFKLIKIFGTFTSWFWIFGLTYKKDLQVKKVLEAFKKFVDINPKIYRLIDLEDFSLSNIPPIEIHYILVEI